MKFTIKKAIAAIAAAATIAAMPMSASAATEQDVVNAARGAGFLEQYVQMLENYLKVTKFTPEQYDIMVSKLYSAGSEYDKEALKRFGKTVAEMKRQDSSNSGSEAGNTVDPEFQKKLEEIAKNMDDNSVKKIITEMQDTAKQVGVDLSFEKKGEKEYIVTIKDKDGNVQMVMPVGKLVDTTGAEESDDISIALILAVFGGSAALGCAGAYVLASISKKKED